MQLCPRISLGLVALATVGMSSCDIYARYDTVISYGNMKFVARSKGFEIMTIDSPPLPPNVEVKSADGKKFDASAITKEVVSAAYEKPRVSTDNSGEGHVDVFGNDDCMFDFVNDKFSKLRVGKGTQITNRSNDLSLSLPTTESEIRRVFGKPTSVERIKVKEQW